MNWLNNLHKFANNPSMVWVPLMVFIAITLVGILYGFAMGWIGAIIMFAWNFFWYLIIISFIEAFISLLNAYQVSEYIPDYILEPLTLGIWLMIANLIGYFIVFLFKNKITSRMKKYKESGVSVWQDRIMGAGIMVVAVYPVSFFGSATIAIAGHTSGPSETAYTIGLKGISLGRYEAVAKQKAEFNSYYELIADEEATELFMKMMTLDPEWLANRTVEEVALLNTYNENISTIINNVDYSEHFVENLYMIAEDREIEISKRIILDDLENPVIDTVPHDILGTPGNLQIKGLDITNIGTGNMEAFVRANVIDMKIFDDSNIANEITEGYINSYYRSFLTAFSAAQQENTEEN